MCSGYLWIFMLPFRKEVAILRSPEIVKSREKVKGQRCMDIATEPF